MDAKFYTEILENFFQISGNTLKQVKILTGNGPIQAESPRIVFKKKQSFAVADWPSNNPDLNYIKNVKYCVYS